MRTFVGNIVLQFVVGYELISILMEDKSFLRLPLTLLSGIMKASVGMFVLVRNFPLNHPDIFMLHK